MIVTHFDMARIILFLQLKKYLWRKKFTGYLHTLNDTPPKIVNSIEEDRLNPPEFQTLGSNFLKGYNCFTWCLAKLEVGGVNTKEIVNNPLFTRTSDYIPPSSTNEQPNFSYCSLM